jgi:hypothetical protein
MKRMVVMAGVVIELTFLLFSMTPSLKAWLEADMARKSALNITI